MKSIIQYKIITAIKTCGKQLGKTMPWERLKQIHTWNVFVQYIPIAFAPNPSQHKNHKKQRYFSR